MCPQLAGVTGNRFLVTFARFGTTDTRVFDRHTESLYNNIKKKKRKQTFIQIEMVSKLKLNNTLRHYTLKQA